LDAKKVRLLLNCLIRIKIATMSSQNNIEVLQQEINDISRELGISIKTCEKLEHINKMLSQVIQVSSIPTFVIDSNHTVILWNKALEKLTGKTEDEMLGTQKQWMAFYAGFQPLP